MGCIFSSSPTNSKKETLEDALTEPVEHDIPQKRVEKTDKEWKQQLSHQEYRVLRLKATDAAQLGKSSSDKANPKTISKDTVNFTHRYPTKGYFACRGCSNPLYSFESKFKSGCGWPAFDKCFKNSIVTKTDRSYGMNRIEILCSKCDGHLGHVFEGERFTKTNQRHCVNSSSIKYYPNEIPKQWNQDSLTESDEIR